MLGLSSEPWLAYCVDETLAIRLLQARSADDGDPATGGVRGRPPDASVLRLLPTVKD